MERTAYGWRGTFTAMASPCEVLVASDDPGLAERAVCIAEREALRIEHAFSRYRIDNIVHAINTSTGSAIQVDEETARLLDFADNCYELSDGAFDITSGVLRRAWRFEPGADLPSTKRIRTLLKQVGWKRIKWQRPVLSIPVGMELDFGGIGKEYAVDCTVSLLRSAVEARFLVNFGGDIRVNGPQPDGRPWTVGIETPDVDGHAGHLVKLTSGALGTSGDTMRYLMHDGVRYSHVLDARTGWPVPDAPRSVTARAATCIEAGMLATMAMLRGSDAESFLRDQGVRAWCFR